MDIVLIGMPGCGKSTIGKLLAQRTDMELVDTDAEIVAAEGREINEIFAADGEEYFRSAETKCLKSVLGYNRIIATGGGIVVTPENHDILKNSDAAVVFIDRPLECIMSDVDTSARPLLADGKERLVRLHSERYDRYMSMCDIRIINDKTAEEAVDKIYANIWQESKTDIIKKGRKANENNGNKRS